MNRGKLIVFEGLDRSGKTSIIHHFIKPYFVKNDVDVMFVRDPGNTIISEKIRSIILQKQEEETLVPLSELLLLYAARVQMVCTLVEPALRMGKHVISDRYIWSTLAYQGGGRSISVDVINSLNRDFLGQSMPDFTIYLDIDVETSIQRRSLSELDRIEEEDAGFFTKVRSSYLELAERFESQNKAVIVKANQDPNTVASLSLQAVIDFLSQH